MPYRSLAQLLIAVALMLDCSAAAAQSQQRAPSQRPAEPQPLVRASFLAQMDAQFGKMDADKDGRLDRTEIERFELQKAVAKAQARNESLFDQLDVNKNGQISATEFAKLVTEPAAVSAQPMLSREDGNRDGLISLTEHRAATLANFDRLDTDKDGIVSVAEMKAGGIAPR